ncbi:MAG: hypothetical protein CMJ19_09960 [Phycisphaeraceae bacterium]|nr:hypothetical protein [Phycisphaeraceae bacterium]
MTTVMGAEIVVKVNESDPVGIKEINEQITLENWTFQKGQEVQFRMGWRWATGIVQQVHGELYLVSLKHMDDDKSHWYWMRAFNLRDPKNTSFKGMVRQCHMQMSVGDDNLAISLAKAKTRLQYLVQTFGTTYEPIADTHQNSRRFMEKRRDRLRLPVKPLLLAKAVAVVKGPWQPMVDPGPTFKPVTLPIFEQIEWDHQRTMAMAMQQGDHFFMATHKSTCAINGGYLVNLISSQLINCGKFSEATNPIAISPDGKRVAGHAPLCVSFQRYRVDVWDWGQPTPDHRISFEVPEGEELEEFSWVKWARFTHDNALLVMTPWNKLFAVEPDSAVMRWQLDTGQPLGQQTQPAVSANGKFVAVFSKTNQSILLIDVKSGQAINTISQVPFDPKHLQISRDGQYLMAARDRSFKLWSLDDGKDTPLIHVVPASRSGRTAFKKNQPNTVPKCVLLSHGLVMLDKDIFDGRTGQHIWKYKQLPQGEVVGDMFYAIDLKKMPRVLQCWPLLRQHVINALPGNDHDFTPIDLSGSISIDLSEWQIDDPEKKIFKKQLIASILQKNRIYSEKMTPLRIKFKTKNGKKNEMHIGYGTGVNFTVISRDRIATLYLETPQQTVELQQVTKKFTHRNTDKDKTLTEIAQEMAKVDIHAFEDFILPERLAIDQDKPLGQSFFTQD